MAAKRFGSDSGGSRSIPSRRRPASGRVRQELARKGIEVIERLSTSFDSLVLPRDLEIVQTWESYTHQFFRFKKRDGEVDLVLKLAKRGTDLRPVEIKRFFDRFRSMLENHPGATVRVPEILAWSEHPNAFCMPYIDGVGLPEVLQRRDGLSREQVFLAQCGLALGLFHQHDWEPPNQLDFDEAREKALAATSVLAKQRPPVALDMPSVADAVDVRPAFGDFTPQQFRVDRQGQIWLTDHPASLMADHRPVHADIATFLSSVDSLWSGRRWLQTIGGRQASDDLRRAWHTSFLHGYFRSGRIDMSEPEHKALVTYYRLRLQRNAAQRAWKRGRYLVALKHWSLGGARWALP